MMLQDIIAYKRKEIDEKRELIPVKLLERSIYFETPVVSLREYILRDNKSGIIAEIKRRSPSKGVLNSNVSVERTSIGYMMAGASAISILTDKKFFGGSNEDLMTARHFNYCPILQKDFILDEYQIIEAKSIGADAILLIAACLDADKIGRLSKFARSLGMEVLVEIHARNELSDSIIQFADLLGVNNRDLQTFKVDISTSLSMGGMLPEEVVCISESGIDDPQSIALLRETGYQGFLIGESFMKHRRPEIACQQFIKELDGETNQVRVEQ